MSESFASKISNKLTQIRNCGRNYQGSWKLQREPSRSRFPHRSSWFFSNDGWPTAVTHDSSPNFRGEPRSGRGDRCSLLEVSSTRQVTRAAINRESECQLALSKRRVSSVPSIFQKRSSRWEVTNYSRLLKLLNLPWKEYLRKMEKVFSVLTQCNGPPPLLISARIRASFLFSSFHPLPFVRSAAGCSSWITAFRLVRLLLQRRCHRPRISIRHVQFAVVGIRFSRNCAPHGAASCLLPLPSSNRSSLGGKEREVACEKFLPLQYGNNSLFLFHESFHHSLYVPMNLKLNRSYYHGNNFIRTYDKCAGRQMVMSRR